jgi:hypothetical protein
MDQEMDSAVERQKASAACQQEVDDSWERHHEGIDKEPAVGGDDARYVLGAGRYRDSVKERAPLRPWLWRAARNGCLESRSVVWFPASSETFQ